MGAGEVMSAGAAIVAVIVWLVRLEGRVTSHDREMKDLKADIRYVRSRIDDALNGRH